MITNTAPYWEHHPAYNPASVQEIVAWAVAQIKEHGIEAVAASGNSGLAIAGAIGYAAQIPVFAVRKPGDKHSQTTGYAPNGPVARWAFVDDLIESGSTFDRVRKAVHAEALTTSAVPSLILLYCTMYDKNTTYHLRVDGGAVPLVVFPWRA